MGSLGVIEYMIFGFIGFNLALASSYIIQRGVQRIQTQDDE